MNILNINRTEPKNINELTVNEFFKYQIAKEADALTGVHDSMAKHVNKLEELLIQKTLDTDRNGGRLPTEEELLAAFSSTSQQIQIQ